MKTRIFTLVMLTLASIFLVGADFQPEATLERPAERPFCSGYTIIEAGKGIDCYGDTVKLVKNRGYYELVRAEVQEPS